MLLRNHSLFAAPGRPSGPWPSVCPAYCQPARGGTDRSSGCAEQELGSVAPVLENSCLWKHSLLSRLPSFSKRSIGVSRWGVQGHGADSRSPSRLLGRLTPRGPNYTAPSTTLSPPAFPVIPYPAISKISTSTPFGFVEGRFLASNSDRWGLPQIATYECVPGLSQSYQ